MGGVHGSGRGGQAVAGSGGGREGSELLLRLVALLPGVFELEAELIEPLSEAVGALSVAETASGEVADPDPQGFVWGFASGSFILPGIAAAHASGDQDAGRGLKSDRRGSPFYVHGIIPGPRGEPSGGSKIELEKAYNPNFRSAWGHPPTALIWPDGRPVGNLHV